MSTSTRQARESFTLMLDRSIPLAEQIACGNYGYVDKFCSSQNFSLTKTGHREVSLFDPSGVVTSEEMIARMKHDGFVPATLDDALAMGARHPERQRQNPIVFLGTVWTNPQQGIRYVPVLHHWDDRRKLDLQWFGFDWLGAYRFAAVRES